MTVTFLVLLIEKSHGSAIFQSAKFANFLGRWYTLHLEKIFIQSDAFGQSISVEQSAD
jgi:hypothetical protein